MLNNNKTVKWKRFSRASYAVFNSLHKEVAIGVLSVAMLHCADLKAGGLAVRAIGSSRASSIEQHPSLTDDSLGIALADLEVFGTRVPLTESQAPRMVTVLQAADIAAAAVQSINDLLEYAVGIDVRQRGEMGVQTDISVRGGTFDQITILLNGINISSPHTGHLSADFPVSMDDIERIEVVEGPAARVFGTSAFTGVVNVVTKGYGNVHSPKPELAMHLRGGDHGYAGADGRVAFQLPYSSHAFSGGYSRSDGATPNSDFTNTHFFVQGAISPNKDTSLSYQAGYSYKPYGANTFYGASSTDQWESNERWMVAVKAETQWGRLHIAPQVYWNRWNDHYQWHKDVSPSGENMHKVDVYGAALNTWFQTSLGKTAIGVEVRSDGIWSTNLGVKRPDMEAPMIKLDGIERTLNCHDRRTNISAYLEHNILLRQWTLSLGVLANRNSGLDNRWRLYPGIDLSYRPADKWKLFMSWNMALRMPTFTDLYYSGKGIEGNNNLSPEKTNDVSVGSKFRTSGWDIQGEVFYSHKSDMIDWVVYEDETYDAVGNHTDRSQWTYRSGNFRLDNVGVEMCVAMLPSELFPHSSVLRRVSVDYAYISENISYPRAIALSKYAQEYLRHKVVVRADGRIPLISPSKGAGRERGSLSWSASWRWQERTGEGNNPYALLDARLTYTLRNLSIYIDCTNILNKEYFDYSIVPQPRRGFKAGVRLNL